MRTHKYDNQTLLIIGAGGQDATLLAQKYSRANMTVIGVGNPHSQLRYHPSYKKNISYDELFYLDLASPKLCIEFLNFIKPNRVIHAAAVHANSSNMDSFASKNLERIWTTSVQIVDNVLSWQIKNSFTKSLFLNSSQIFGESQEVVDANSPHYPQNQYAKSKSYAFNLIKGFQYSGIDARIAILFPHTSPFSSKKFLFQEIAEQICNTNSSSKVIRVANSLKSFDITDARDMATWLYSFFESEGLGLNCVFGSGRLFKIRNIISDALEIMEHHNYRIEDIAPEESSSCWASTTEMLQNVPDWRIGKSPSLTLVDIVQSFGKKI